MTSRRQVLIASALGATASALGIAASPRVLAQGAARTSARIAFLCISPLTEAMLRAVPSQLARSGWIEGKNVSYDWVNAARQPAALAKLAAEMLERKPDVVVADTNGTAQATMRLAPAIPIAVFFSLDPVGAGLAQSLSHPGGSATGLVWGEPRLAAKIVEYLHQAAPHARRLAVLFDPGVRGMQAYVDADAVTARALGLEPRNYLMRSAEDLAPQLEAMRKDGVHAIKAALGGNLAVEHLREILDYSSTHKVATVSVGYFAVQMGALLAYYPNDTERLGRISALIDRLLRGAKPADIPFEYPSRFDLAINLRTAKALGLNMPQSLLMSATALVE